jgi:phage shock protein PspC (stress-responsive transcriptional regulator)
VNRRLRAACAGLADRHPWAVAIVFLAVVITSAAALVLWVLARSPWAVLAFAVLAVAVLLLRLPPGGES